MALTECPADWSFVIPVPHAKDTNSRLSRSWEIELSQPISRGGQEFLLTDPLRATAEIWRSSQGVDVLIGIASEVATKCRRCCAPLTVAIQEDFRYSFVLQSNDAGIDQEEEFYDSDTVILPVSRLGPTLDVTDLVWECLIESLPLYAQCAGECVFPVAPSAQQADPRFLVLADLLEQEKHKGGK